MLTRLRRRLNYANVVATLALFVALGGSSYAVSQISGSQLKNNSVAGKKLKRNTIGSSRIKESRLGTVPRARNAARLGGLTARRLLLKCPAGTLPAADVCVETQARAPLNYSSAVSECGTTDSPRTPGRRLPTHGELRRAFDYDEIGPIAPRGELTAEVYPSGSSPGQVEVLYMTDELGHVGVAADHVNDAKAFRCVADPLN
jgi:hypothetical protein